MNDITIHIQMDRIGGNIPTNKIDQLLEQFAELMNVTDVSFESEWISETSRITYKGKLKRGI